MFHLSGRGEQGHVMGQAHASISAEGARIHSTSAQRPGSSLRSCVRRVFTTVRVPRCTKTRVLHPGRAPQRLRQHAEGGAEALKEASQERPKIARLGRLQNGMPHGLIALSAVSKLAQAQQKKTTDETARKNRLANIPCSFLLASTMLLKALL